MAMYAIVGGHGAPGATVTALAMLHAWPLQSGQRVLLAECDPDGGVILPGALEGRLDGSRGLGQLGVADRRGQLAQTLMTQLTDVSPGGTADRLLLPGVSDPAQYPGLAYVWHSLAELLVALEGQGVDVLLDLGRSGATGPSAVLAQRADAVLVVVRSTLRSLTTAHPRVAALRADLEANGTGSDGLGLVMIEEGPYKAADVSAQLGSPVVGLLPHSPAVAAVLSDGGNTHDRRFVRSPLLRASRTVIDEARSRVSRRRLRLTPQQVPYPEAEQTEYQQPVPPPRPAPQQQPQPQPQYQHQPQPDWQQEQLYRRPAEPPEQPGRAGTAGRPVYGPVPNPVPPSPPAPMPMPVPGATGGATNGATNGRGPAEGAAGDLHNQVVSHAR
ncbi:hypothetical protein [Streptacidiphilus albus]|uniref:hypothetical protein n=1 Tax=Streptacidiphilus albus TaxID=105425 RepID=UPI0007C82F34|nr:hypothetical protein [Streptacidiphilus albus]